MNTQAAHSLKSTYIRLRPDASAEKIAVTADFWPDLMAGKLGRFRHEYLVTQLEFTESWNSWENHRNGDEIVILLRGEATMIMETEAGEASQTLTVPGEFVFVPRDTWHTANIEVPCSMVFITAGEGTVVRTR